MRKNRTNNKNTALNGNPLFLGLLVMFLVMTSIIGAIACYYSYNQRQMEVSAKYDQRLLQIVEKYKEITGEFWLVYLPIYEQGDSVILNFFNKDSKGVYSTEQIELRNELAQMANRNTNIQWIALYSPIQKQNFVYLVNRNLLLLLPDDFLNLIDDENRMQKMQIYPEKTVSIYDQMFNSLIISGGAPGNADGRIIVGYDISGLERLCNLDAEVSSLNFHVLSDDVLIFTSAIQAPEFDSYQSIKQQKNCCIDGKKCQVKLAEDSPHGELIFYTVENSELFWYVSRSMALVVCLVLLMATLSIFLYLFVLRSINREVNAIRDGLEVLGRNHLEYRIQESFVHPELKTVASSINQMATELNDNIERAQEYERQQKLAEIQELQAKFNPHFLYNTLEIFRRRCFQNGDEETADMIRQTASFFRVFIDSKTFIPIQEELAFSKRYLDLLRFRFGDSVEVLYDVDTEVLQYGIIRNAFQPIIENYFEHGYNSGIKENRLIIRGYLYGEDEILFEVEDNGLGVKDEMLKEINNKLQQPLVSAEECYGLRNLHQRIRLFYGEPCGIMMKKKNEKGVTVEIRVKRQKVL